MFNGHLSSVVALRASFSLDSALKVHPKMTTDHWSPSRFPMETSTPTA
jgi:hypothetical protein